jgi:hypothetical protein
MNDTEIREALSAVGDAVEVPVPDAVGFGARVRAERRRRGAGRAAVVAVAAAAAGVVVALGVGGIGGADDPDRRGDSASPPVAAPGGDLPVRLDGRLALVRGDGTVQRSGLRVEEVVGRTAEGVVVVDDDSVVLVVPLGRDGGFGRPRELLGEPVQQVLLDKSGLVMAFVDLDETLHVREVGAGSDLFTHDLGKNSQRLLAVDGTRWLQALGSRSLSLHDGSDAGTVVDVAFGFSDAELAGQTLAVVTDDGVELFESWNGAQRFGSLGAEVGSLSPDGTAVATVTGIDSIDRGMSDEAWLIDAFSGELATLSGYDGGPAIDVAWVDDDEFAVHAGAGQDELWVCSTETRSCGLRLSAEVNALRLPTR